MAEIDSRPISPPSPAEAPEAMLPEREPEPFSELQRAGFAAIRSGAANRAPASETQTATPEPSVAWLIERGTGTSGVHWFCGQGGDVAHDWTSNANNALKFPNRESAQREIDERSGVTGIHSPLGVATEHVFLTQHEFGPPRAAQPATTGSTCGAVMPRSNPPGVYVCRLPAPHPESWHAADMGAGAKAFWRDERPAPTLAHAFLMETVKKVARASGFAGDPIMDQESLIEHIAASPSRDQTPELNGEWCVEAFHRVNPGAAHTPYRSVPSLYLLDFARAVLAEFSDLKETPPHV